MNDNPVSVMVTAYQSAKYLPDCLESIYSSLRDLPVKWELLIGIDGCPDSLHAALSHPVAANTSVYWFPDNCGTYIVSNTLISMARYRTLVRFDSDDIMLPEFGRQILNAPEWPAIVYLQMARFYGDKIPNEQELTGQKLSPAAGVVIITPGVMEVLGGYRPWRCAADSDLTSRARHAGLGSKGAACRCMQTHPRRGCAFLHRLHSDNLTRKVDTGPSSKLRDEYHRITRESSDIYVHPVVADCVKLVEATI